MRAGNARKLAIAKSKVKAGVGRRQRQESRVVVEAHMADSTAGEEVKACTEMTAVDAALGTMLPV
jgi:hypothetical protein